MSSNNNNSLATRATQASQALTEAKIDMKVDPIAKRLQAEKPTGHDVAMAEYYVRLLAGTSDKADALGQVLDYEHMVLRNEAMKRLVGM